MTGNLQGHPTGQSVRIYQGTHWLQQKQLLFIVGVAEARVGIFLKVGIGATGTLGMAKGKNTALGCYVVLVRCIYEFVLCVMFSDNWPRFEMGRQRETAV